MATIGEPAETAQRNLYDWNTHLDDFEANHTSVEYRTELVKGAVTHVVDRWTDSQVSTVPMTLSVVFILLTSSFIDTNIGVGVTFSLASEVHISVAYLAFALALTKTRPPEFGWLLTLAVFGLSSGILHHAIGAMDDGNVPLLAPAKVVTSVGLAAMAISSLRHRVTLGCSHASRWIFHIGLSLHAVAYVSVISVTGLLSFTAASMVVAISVLAIVSLDRVWVAGHLRASTIAKADSPPSLAASDQAGHRSL